MAVMFFIIATVLCVFCVLYKSLAPRPTRKSNVDDRLEEKIKLNVVSSNESDGNNLLINKPTEKLTELEEDSTSLSTVETSLLLLEGDVLVFP